MKRFNKPALLLVSLIGLSVISSLAPLVSAVSSSGVGDEGLSGRERWWDSQWHYRKSITIDANGYDRRWGLPIETSIGIYNFPDLDMNSIRLIYKGSEIPSSYERIGTPPTYTGDVLTFVTNESMVADGEMELTVYYDSNANGMKPDPDYGEDWAQGVIDTYNEAEDTIDAYNEKRGFYKDQYEAQFTLFTSDGHTGTVNGYDVVFDDMDGTDSATYPDMPDDPASNVWEYAHDYPANYDPTTGNYDPHPIYAGDPARYITGDGTFYWLDGRSVFRDDQGNWYFVDPEDGPSYVDGDGVTHEGGIVGALYFGDGHYHILVDNALAPGQAMLIDLFYSASYPITGMDDEVIGYGAWVFGAGSVGLPVGIIDIPVVTIGTEQPYYRFYVPNIAGILLFQDSTGHWHAKYDYALPHEGYGAPDFGSYRIEEDKNILGDIISGDWQVRHYPDITLFPNAYEVIAEYDASLNALLYDGNLIYYDEIGDYWLWEGADGSIGMLFEIEKMATYTDADGTDYAIYSDEAGGWIYEVDGVVTGYISKDLVTGDYMIHYLPTSIMAVTVGESFFVDGAEIVYDGVTDMQWEYAATGDPVPELAGALHVASYQDELIYATTISVDNPFTTEVDPQDETVWYYLETGVMVGQMFIFHDADGNEIYTVMEGIDTRAMYWDDGVFYMWSGTEWLAYGPFDYGGQSVFMSSAFSCIAPDGLGIGDAYSNGDAGFGTIKSVMSGSAVIETGPGTSFIETAALTTWRGVPDYRVDFSAAEPDFLSTMGSALLNLNGSIQFDSNILTRFNIMDYIQTLGENLALLAGAADTFFGTAILQFLEDTADWTEGDWLGFADSIDRYMVFSEVAPIDPDALDFATDPRVEDKTGVYVTGNAYDSLLSIPIEVSTRYVGVFDLLTATGWGLSINALTPITDYVVEVWQETIGTSKNYYINILVNPDSVLMPNNFELNLVYLDSSVAPDIAMLDSIPFVDGGLQEVIVDTSDVADPAIGIEIGIIILPVKAETGDPVNVTVGIKGETIGAIKFRLDNNPAEFDWDVRYDFYIINVPVEHWGQRVSTIVAYPTTGTHKITVVVYDTSNNVVAADTKSATIDIKPRASDIFAWVAALIATLFGIIGIAIVRNKKVGRAKAAGCIGDACNI